MGRRNKPHRLNWTFCKEKQKALLAHTKTVLALWHSVDICIQEDLNCAVNDISMYCSLSVWNERISMLHIIVKIVCCCVYDSVHWHNKKIVAKLWWAADSALLS